MQCGMCRGRSGACAPASRYFRGFSRFTAAPRRCVDNGGQSMRGDPVCQRERADRGIPVRLRRSALTWGRHQRYGSQTIPEIHSETNRRKPSHGQKSRNSTEVITYYDEENKHIKEHKPFSGRSSTASTPPITQWQVMVRMRFGTACARRSRGLLPGRPDPGAASFLDDRFEGATLLV
jgi:hypothetical protein